MIKWRVANMIGLAVFTYWLVQEFIPMATWWWHGIGL